MSRKKWIVLGVACAAAIAAVVGLRENAGSSDPQGIREVTEDASDMSKTGQAASSADTGSGAGDTTPGWKKHADDPVTLRWYVNYSWFGKTWGTDMVSQAITAETGTSVKFLTPEGNESEKLDTMIQTDSLPDIITLGWWETQLNEMISKKQVYALNQLADKYDPYFYKVTNPEEVSWYTQKDGNIYGYPNSAVTPSDLKKSHKIGSNQTFLVRKDIYEAIGSPDMSTQAGFEAAVKKAKELYPEVNGEPLIPIGAQAFASNGNGSFDTYLMNFLAIPYEKNGEYYDRLTDPEYLSWLKFFNRMYREGYISDDTFVDQRTQIDEKIGEGRYFCMLYQYTDMEAQEKELYAADPNHIYIAVKGPANSKGDDPKLPVTGANGWTVTLISKNCKHPDRAIQLMDYFLSEHGQKMIYLGVKGKMWDDVDGVPKIHDDIRQVRDNDRTTYDRVYGADDTYWMLQTNTVQMKWDQDMEEPMKSLREWSYPYATYTAQYEGALPSGSKEQSESNRIDELWSETLPKLLTAPDDASFDRIMTDFTTKRNELGFKDVMQAKTKVMNESKKKLGLK